MKRISLFGRKRIGELGENSSSQVKKEELMALKLESINKEAAAIGSLRTIPIEYIQPDPNQPRKEFKNLDSLAASIREKGVIQPIIVNSKNSEGMYTIIVGERRYRAAKMANLHSLNCIIRDEADAEVMILQLLENDQRESVSPLEESDALIKLINDLKVNKSEIARELGRDGPWVAMRVGLQKASDDIKALIKDGFIEDIRTLHELRKFEEESPQKAQKLIKNIRNNAVSGSYRQVIASSRITKKAKNSAKVPKVHKVVDMRHVDDKLILDVGRKHPLEFKVAPEIIESFWQNFLKGRFRHKK